MFMFIFEMLMSYTDSKFRGCRDCRGEGCNGGGSWEGGREVQGVHSHPLLFNAIFI